MPIIFSFWVLKDHSSKFGLLVGWLIMVISSEGVRGVMAVVAVSGSVVFVAMHMHKRLLFQFMKKIESELCREDRLAKKRVRFAQDVSEPSSNNKEYRNRQLRRFPGKQNR